MSWSSLPTPSVKPLQNAHVVGQDPLRLQERGVVENRRGGQAGRRARNTDAVRARQGLPRHRIRRIDEIDRVDAVAAAALGEIDDIIEDGETAEVRVLADLVRLVAKLRDVEAADGRGESWVLRDEGLGLGGKDLRAPADDDPVRLRISAVPGIAGRIENVRARSCCSGSPPGHYCRYRRLFS